MKTNENAPAQVLLPKEHTLLTKDEVANLMRLSAGHFDRLRADKEAGFPEGVPVYGRKLVWRKSEVDAYLDALFAARDKQRAA